MSFSTAQKRKLTEEEIRDALSFIVPSPNLPPETAKLLADTLYKDLYKQLSAPNLKLYPKMFPVFKNQLREMFISSLIQPGESVGIITAQSIGERQTQTNLNNFHRAGSADKQPTVSKFSELLNATSKSKSPSFYIYFQDRNNSIAELRQAMGSTITQITLKRLTRSVSYCVNKKTEPWYKLYTLYSGQEIQYNHCVSIDIDMDVLFEFRLTLETVADRIVTCSGYSDIQCVFSPDCYGRLDVFVDTYSVPLPDRCRLYINEQNIHDICLEEVLYPSIEHIVLAGIPGVLNVFFLKEDGKWLLETENVCEKVAKMNRKGMGGSASREKAYTAVKRYKTLLNHTSVDATRTISNNLWDIYYTLGIEAARQFMIDEFLKIMDGINACHVMLLVDKMTYTGTILSVTRYATRRDDTGVFSRASFEETLDNFLKAGIFGQEEEIKGVSSAIICGTRAHIGTGFGELKVDLSKLT